MRAKRVKAEAPMREAYAEYVKMFPHDRRPMDYHTFSSGFRAGEAYATKKLEKKAAKNVPDQA